MIINQKAGCFYKQPIEKIELNSFKRSSMPVRRLINRERFNKGKERGKNYTNSSLTKRFFRYASASWRTDGYGAPRFVSPHLPPLPFPAKPFFQDSRLFSFNLQSWGNGKFRLSSSKLKMIK